MMYYSSNGLATIGGFDVFKTAGTDMKDWMTPENAGLPYNSSADDYYFRRSSMGNGYVVSNRVYGLDKTTSTNDDIFIFSESVERTMASGNIIDEVKKTNVENVWVALYERTKDGKTRLLENKEFANGKYEFGLLEGKDYRIEANADGYMLESTDFSTIATEGGMSDFSEDIVLGKQDDMAIGGETGGAISGKPNGIFNDPRPIPSGASSTTSTISSAGDKVKEMVTTPTSDVVTSAASTVVVPATSTEITTPSNNVITSTPNTVVTSPTAPVVTSPSSISIHDIANGTTEPVPSYTTPATTNYPTTSYPAATPSTAPAATYVESGVVYKVQLIAVRKYNESHTRYDNAKNYGALQTEYLPERNLTRVLLGTFSTKEEAESIRRNMKEQREFRTAVVVRYENGVRIDPWAK